MYGAFSNETPLTFRGKENDITSEFSTKRGELQVWETHNSTSKITSVGSIVCLTASWNTCFVQTCATLVSPPLLSFGCPYMVNTWNVRKI